MASEHRWIGSTGDWGLASNWSTNQVPGAGGVGTDIAIFDGTSQISVDTGLDRVTAGDPAIKRIVTTAAYRGNIGLSGTPLVHAIPSASDIDARVVHTGSGNLFFKGKTVIPAVPASVHVNSANQSGGIVLDGSLQDVTLQSGRVEILSTSTVFGLMVGHGPGSHLVMREPHGFIDWHGGTLEYKADLAVGNPVWLNLHTGVTVITGKLDDLVHVLIGPQASVRYEPATQPAGTDTPSFFVSGYLDLRKSAFKVNAQHIFILPGGMVDGDAMMGGGMGGTSYVDFYEAYP